MTENNMDSAVQSLSDQTKKLEIASYYTYGDMEKAKQMVAGTFKDIYILKVRLASSSIYGAIILFFNVNIMIMHDVYALISQGYDLADIKTTQNWRSFENTLMEIESKGEHDHVLGNHLKEELLGSFPRETANRVKALLENNDAIALNHFFQRLLQEKSGFQNIDITVDYEQTTSLDMEMNSQVSRKVDSRDLQAQKERNKKPEEEKKQADPDDPLAEREVKLLVMGSLLLSPIKGKDISKLEENDRIRISVTDENPKAKDLLKAFDAVTSEGERKPISGRIISVKYRPKKGYLIHAVVAKGIYVKIEEEEENIKVSMDPSSNWQQTVKKEEPKGSSLPIVIILLILFLIIVGVVISFILSM